MKTTLLVLAGCSLFLASCSESEKQLNEHLSDDEIKSKVDAEEIRFETPTSEIIGQVEIEGVTSEDSSRKQPELIDRPPNN